MRMKISGIATACDMWAITSFKGITYFTQFWAYWPYINNPVHISCEIYIYISKNVDFNFYGISIIIIMFMKG